MALVSLAGYATDINEVNFSVGTVPYGTKFTHANELVGTPVADHFTTAEHFLVTYDIPLTKGTHYTWNEKFYSNEACTTEVALATATVGTYYVKIEGIGAFEGTKVSSFKVGKREVTVPLNAALTKTYGAADPALTDDNIKWTSAVGFQGTDDKSVFTGTLSYTHENENVGGPYDINVTGYTATNYTLKVTGGINITQKAITTAMITPVTLSGTYKAAAFTEFAVDVKDGSTPLVAGTDFTLNVYEESTFATKVASPKDVRTGADKKYYLAIENKAGGNYSVTGKLAAGTFEITKAGLTVRVLPQSKAYNNSLALPSTAYGTAFEVLGALGTDDIDKDGNIATFTNVSLTGNTSKNAGDYAITPDITLANQNTNYDYNFVPATFKINKRELTITANKAKKVFGKAETAVTKMDGGAADAIGYGGVTLTPTLEKDADGADIPWAVPAAEEADMKKASVADNPSTLADETEVNGDLKVVRPGAGTDETKKVWADALEVSYTAAADVWKNYTVITKKGDFTIVGGKIYVTALNQKKNYGEADPEWTAVKDKNFIVTGLSGEDALTTLPTLTRAAGETVNDYVITPAGAVAPDGYEEIVYATGTFTINARPITIVAQPQTLKVGETVAALDQNAFTITNTKADEGLNTGDKASDVFSLVFGQGKDITGAPDASIDNVALTGGALDAHAPYNAGIFYALGTKAGNYNITFTPGKLIVIDPDATLVLNRPNKASYTATPALDNAATVIAAAAADKYTATEANAYNGGLTGAISTTTVLDATQATKLNGLTGVSKTTYAAGESPVAADCNLYNATLTGAVSTADVQKKYVTFSDFAMVAEKWYPIVLPFATTVKEVSETFGYAIVNILKKDNTDKTKIAFKLHMGEIPANEPFVVKVYEDVNMNEVTFGDPTDQSTAKVIVNSAAPEVADASGVKFIGSYSAKTDGFKANEAFFSISASKNDYYWGSASNKTYMAPLSAYFRVPANEAAARTIEFEEADGTVTAIQAVNVKAEARSAEGWYTIGGMKLQGAPTQKGIYIQNGKKVIIK